jgi:hypothetical protein
MSVLAFIGGAFAVNAKTYIVVNAADLITDAVGDGGLHQRRSDPPEPDRGGYQASLPDAIKHISGMPKNAWDGTCRDEGLMSCC